MNTANKQYGRLTKKGGYTKELDLKQELGYSYIYNRLAELEDKIMGGTLVGLPCKVGDTATAIIDTLLYDNSIQNVKIKGLAYIVEDWKWRYLFLYYSTIKLYTPIGTQSLMFFLLFSHSPIFLDFTS